MVRRACLIILAVMMLLQFQTEKSHSSNLDNLLTIDRVFKATAIRVYAQNRSVVGTGFLSKLQQTDSMLVFISNKHIFAKDSTLELIIPIYDSTTRIIDTFDIMVPIFKNGNKLYLTPSDSLDIAATLISKKFGGKNVGNFASLPTEFYAEFETLYAGLNVKFYGFPLGMTVNRWNPLVRSGIIAGTDSSSRTIYLDAQAFGGSSGSPVFVDIMASWSTEYAKKYPSKYLIGIISGYKPFIKQLINTQTNRVEMVQTENSGLAIVMPASEFQDLADRLWEMFSKAASRDE